MKIKSMTATFGRLQNARLELGEGLNILEGPNEGGKSTWCAFLRAMLYGIPTRERDTKTAIAEKNRYQPWSGGAMEGAVELEWQGRDITLRRGPRGSTPFGAFSAVYTGTGEPVPGLTGENCGERLLGVPRAVFERTAFVGQSGAAIAADSELEKRIAALVSSGEEEVSYSQVEGRLKEWLRRRKYNKSGLIPKLEGELEVIDDTLARQERSRRQAREAGAEREKLVERRDALRERLWAWRSRENVEKRRRWQQAQSALEAARAEEAALAAEVGAAPDRETLRSAQGDLAYLHTLDSNLRLAQNQVQPARAAAQAARAAAEDPLFPDMTPDQAWQQASRDREAAASGPARPAGWVTALLVLGFVAAAGLFTAGAVLEQWVMMAPAIVLLVAAGLTATIRGARHAAAQRRYETARAALLARYGAQFPDDILARANDYRERYTAAQEAERKLQAVEDSARNLAGQREELKAGLLELVHTFAPEVKDTFGVSAALSRALNLAEKLSNARVRLEGAERLAESLEKPEEGEETAGSGTEDPGEVDSKALAAQIAALEGEIARVSGDLAMARGELSSLGDPDLFEARRGELTEELARRREEYDALALALEGLNEANAQLQERFSPAINRSAGAILAQLTGGKYDKVTLTREFEASAEEKDGVLPRRALVLSQGTAEQLYLAVRLAICDLVLSGGERVPLVLDDALDAFDDRRAALALDYLRRAAAERQILLFTCHGREGALAGSWPEVRVTRL